MCSLAKPASWRPLLLADLEIDVHPRFSIPPTCFETLHLISSFGSLRIFGIQFTRPNL